MGELYLIQPGTQLHRHRNGLALFRGRRRVRAIPVESLDRIVVAGDVTLAPSAVELVLRRGIDTVFLGWSGRYLGRLSGGLGKNVFLRLQQYNRLQDEAFRLVTARAIVSAKVDSQLALVGARLKDAASEALRRGRRLLQETRAAVPAAGDLASLRGHEGRAAAVYFRCLAGLLRPGEFAFTGRNRRPPRDPVNVLLSLGYTLLLSAMDREIAAVGLDPGLGCFHEIAYGRPSLPLDLVEEFRAPAVDALVLRAVNRREFRITDFYFPDAMAEEARRLPEFDELRREAPVILTHGGFQKFIRLFEQRLGERVAVDGGRQTLRGLVRRQAGRFARAVRGEEPYLPTRWEAND
ncbi:MAG TPA: CRISPR-associated endonuclease Cas1 [Acidobacteriota bacterium]|nr:CRISPR-associated endonuclease Cas1 [Acidobacteriota bacterium]HQM63866.1 CRISPR-associated endonuclease Cas1 [Acidobacteriota bacterium]